MARETCDFDGRLAEMRAAACGLPPLQALEAVARRARESFGARFWFAEILGRRWSHVAGAGSESPEPEPVERIPLTPRTGLVVASWGDLSGAERAGLVEFLRAQAPPAGDALLRRDEILAWLREKDDARLESLWRRADSVRRASVGDAVHLRGLIEISNHCVRACGYCGLRAERAALERYRMSAEEIMACARQAVAYGYGTVVLQAGEDPGLSREKVADLIRRIKGETPLAVTLSLGEREDEELAAWREAGADRYLLRFETSNRALYDRIHPPRPGRRSDRIAMLRRLGALGYEVGSGVMIGIPGQTCADLAADVELFRELDLDMIGVGPFIPHPDTPLGRAGAAAEAPHRDQAAGDEQMTCKMVALTRLACARANIPSTTALATLNRESGRELGLQRGANVVMPNLTPPAYRTRYEIYPGKACLFETAEECHACLKHRILALGRRLGVGRGDARRPAPCAAAEA